VIAISAPEANCRNSPPSSTAAAERKPVRVDSLFREELPYHVRPSVRAPKGESQLRSGLLLVAGSGRALLIDWASHCFSQIALFGSKMAMVNVLRAYEAPMSPTAGRTLSRGHPRECWMGSAWPNTPRPLIMCCMRGLQRRFSRPRHASPCGGHAWRVAGDWSPHALLLWISSAHRFFETLPQQGLAGALTAITAAVVRRDPNLSDLFRAAYGVPGDLAGAVVRLSFDMPVLLEQSCFQRWVGRGRGNRVFRVNMGRLTVLAARSPRACWFG